MNLHIFSGFNNYYNRKYKILDSLQEYLNDESLYYQLSQTNFIPNDNIITQHVIGSNVQMYDGLGDYLLVSDDANTVIESRWFIIESVRDRAGQWTLQLRRDVIADYFEHIVDSPMFIEKATLEVNSPLVFNDEQFTVNQIKKSETLLKDKSNCPWLVGYYASSQEALQGTVLTNSSDIPYTQLSTTVEDWNYFKYTTNAPNKQYFLSYPIAGNYRIRATFSPDQVTYTNPDRFETSMYSTDGTTVHSDAEKGSSSLTDWGLYFPGYYPDASNGGVLGTISRVCARLKAVYGTTKVPQLNSQLLHYTPDNLYSQEDTNDLLYELNGSLIRDTAGRFFKVSVISKGTQNGTINLTGQLQLDLKNIALAAGFTQTGTRNDYYQFAYTSIRYEIQLAEQFGLETTYNITANKLITTDSPWNIFAIPYSDSLKIVNQADSSVIIENTNASISLNTIMSMQKNHPSIIYDVQILPYCPVPNLIDDENIIKVSNEKEYSLITSGGETPQAVGIIFNVPEARFSTNLEGYSILGGQTSIEKKLNNQCDKWRISSPNYSNYFDFSVEKNGGVQYFNVDCEYKPFTPYIHINPNFDNLYGEDFNDVRGLVCGGDFSLSQIIDQWEQYQIQNKNFQNIFDRQIQNMEVQHKFGRIQDIAGGIAGVGSGIAGGALAGNMIGGPMGAAVGAIGGGAASLVGGIADIQINEQLRNEAIDYTKDQFGYQLGNIQALPNTISKVSSLNGNNKLFPILEYYTCTDEEKTAFLNKIAWNGMTTMVIGKISDYISNSWSYNGIESKGYIKGQLIRIPEAIGEDLHVVNTIANELNKGIFIGVN